MNWRKVYCPRASRVRSSRFAPRCRVWIAALLQLTAWQAVAQTSVVPPNPEQQGLPLNWRVVPAPPVAKDTQTVAGPSIADQVLPSAISSIEVQAPHHVNEIRTLTQPFLGQSTLAGKALESLRTNIWNLYRQHGRLAGIEIAAVPRSTAEGGSILQVRVREVNVHKINVQQKVPDAVSPKVIDAILDDVRSNVPEGSVLDLNRLDGTIKRRQFLGDASLYAILAPAGDATLDVNLQAGAEDSVPTTWVAQYDNYGMSTYGRNRYTGAVAVPSVLTTGDRLNVLATGSSGMTYGRLAYEMPWSWLGARIAGWTSRVNYRAPSGVDGAVTQFGTNLTYPLHFSDSSIWTGYLDYTNSHQRDHIDALEINDKSVNSVQGRVDASLLLSPSQTAYLSIALQQGWLDLSAIPSALEQDRFSARSDGGFAKLNWAASWTGSFAHKFDARLEANGQYAADNLDDSEKFTLGGPNGVRAYSSGDAMGDGGSLVNAELGYRPSAPLRIYAFYDIGRTERHREPWLTEAVPQRYTLQGAGLGVSYTNSSINTAVSYANKIGSDPGLSYNVDAEDSNKNHQLWVSLSAQF